MPETVLKDIEGGRDLFKSLEKRKNDEEKSWKVYKRIFIFTAIAITIICYSLITEGLINIKFFLNFPFLAFLFLSGLHIITYRVYKFDRMFFSISKVDRANALLQHILFLAFIFLFLFNLSR